MKTMRTHNIIKKTLALCVAFIFALTQTAYALPQDVEVVEGGASVVESVVVEEGADGDVVYNVMTIDL